MTRPKSVTPLLLGIVLIVAGAIMLLTSAGAGGMIPVFIGSALCYLAWQKGRAALIFFGHTCIVLGCFLITWGIYLLPFGVKLKLAHSINCFLGGLCAAAGNLPLSGNHLFKVG